MNAKLCITLRPKFPDVDEKVFRTNYAGYLHEEVINGRPCKYLYFVSRKMIYCKKL